MNAQEKMFVFFAAVLAACNLNGEPIIINPSTHHAQEIPTPPDIEAIRLLCEAMRKKMKQYRTAKCLQKRSSCNLKKRALRIKNGMQAWQKKSLEKHTITPH